MDAQERYFWDLTGYLIVRNVLSPEQITAADAAPRLLSRRGYRTPGGARLGCR